MVKFRIRRAGKRVKSKLITLDFRKVFKYLLGRVSWDKSLDERGTQERWLIFKDHLLQAQERSIPVNNKPGKNAKRPAWMNKELLEKLKCKKRAHREQKQGWCRDLACLDARCPSKPLYRSPSSIEQGRKKYDERLVGQDKDRERSLTNYCHGQNRLDLGKSV